MTHRLQAVAAALAERELDLLLVSHLVNVQWLTGFTGSSAAAVVGADTRRFLTDFRYLTQSEEQVDASWEREIVQDLLEGVAAGLPEGAVRLGFDDDHMSVKAHARLRELVHAPGDVRPGARVFDADVLGAVSELAPGVPA